jgi:CubicO group peptidase (beta-lactamase class C family)
MTIDFCGSPEQNDPLVYEEFLKLLSMTTTTFTLAKVQPSKKAWMVRVDGFAHFVPRSFPYVVDYERAVITIELPEWFELK